MRVSHRRASGHVVGGGLDGVEDALVGAAAAHVLRERLADVATVGLMFAVEEGDGRHDEAGDAVAALHGGFVDEGLLDGVEPSPSASPSIVVIVAAGDGADRRHAGAQRLTVDEDGAGAAEALAAAVLCAGEPCLEADEAEKVAARFGRFVGRAVDVDGDHAPMLSRQRGWVKRDIRDGIAMMVRMNHRGRTGRRARMNAWNGGRLSC